MYADMPSLVGGLAEVSIRTCAEIPDLIPIGRLAELHPTDKIPSIAPLREEVSFEDFGI
jgi:hypothetical protein